MIGILIFQCCLPPSAVAMLAGEEACLATISLLADTPRRTCLATCLSGRDSSDMPLVVCWKRYQNTNKVRLKMSQLDAVIGGVPLFRLMCMHRSA